MTDDTWAEYARLQKLANSSILNDRAWGIDEALDSVLDNVEAGVNTSPRKADNLVTNRAAKHRRRRAYLVEKGYALVGEKVADEEQRLFQFCKITQCLDRCTTHQQRVLLAVGLGETYSDMAAQFDVSENTIKTWVRRARLHLAA